MCFIKIHKLVSNGVVSNYLVEDKTEVRSYSDVIVSTITWRRDLPTIGAVL